MVPSGWAVPKVMVLQKSPGHTSAGAVLREAFHGHMAADKEAARRVKETAIFHMAGQVDG